MILLDWIGIQSSPMQALSCSRIASADPVVYMVIVSIFGGVAARRWGVQCGRRTALHRGYVGERAGVLGAV